MRFAFDSVKINGARKNGAQRQDTISISKRFFKSRMNNIDNWQKTDVEKFNGTTLDSVDGPEKKIHLHEIAVRIRSSREKELLRVPC